LYDHIMVHKAPGVTFINVKMTTQPNDHVVDDRSPLDGPWTEGVPTYTVYMCVFALIALVPPKDAEVLHAFEDKEKGEGKAQD